MLTVMKPVMTIACASLLLGACSSIPRPHDSSSKQALTVSELYHRSMLTPIKKMHASRVHFQKKASTFKALPNPEVPIHVFAHVAKIGDEEIIKPAYDTRFFLYKHNQYALASELY